jgi:shikimate dehydrogenase
MAGAKRCGLIGEHLQHSFSPQIHACLADYSYRLFELSPEAVAPFLRSRDFDGVNVTIPYKKAAMACCDELSDTAKRIGCVNTVVRRDNGTLYGHNTDYDGFLWLMKSTGFDVRGRKAVVLGSGGASLTVRTVLGDLGAGEITVVSRTGQDNYGNLADHKDAALLVNTTPVGMYPHNGESAVSLELLPALECVVDVIYNPSRTKLLLDAQRRGLIWANGLGMLVAQAKAAAELFTGHAIDDFRVPRIRAMMERDTKNIILIGMPGCGKSTIAEELAAQLGRRKIDLDAEVERTAGMCIPELFSTKGEAYFRAQERQALAEFSRQSGLVIATGGGIVTCGENEDLLHQNSVVVWLQRKIGSLPTEGRPLSQAVPPEALYKERETLYRKNADRIIANDSTVLDAVNEIIKELEI